MEDIVIFSWFGLRQEIDHVVLVGWCISAVESVFVEANHRVEVNRAHEATAAATAFLLRLRLLCLWLLLGCFGLPPVLCFLTLLQVRHESFDHVWSQWLLKRFFLQLLLLLQLIVVAG